MVLNLKSFDLFSKPDDPEVMQVKTTSGAIVSAIGILLMLWLTISEFALYRTTEIVNNLVVDAEQQHEEQTFPFVLALAFYDQKCPSIKYSMRDSKGKTIDIPTSNVKLTSWLDPDTLGADEYLRKTKPDDVPGCFISALINVPKVAGELRFFSKDMPEILGYQAPTGLEMPKFNSSHKLVSLKFGPDMKGASYPLDGTVQVAKDGAQIAFDYYLQLVPSRYVTLNGARTDTNQYSVTEFDQKAGTYNGQIVPSSVLFKWDFSPIMVTVKETRRGFLQFVTSLCAIVGGVFAVAGVINSGIFRTSQLLQSAPRKLPRSDE